MKINLLPVLLAGLITASSARAQDDDLFGNIAIDLNGSGTNQSGFSVLGWLSEEISYGLEAPGPMFSRSAAELNKVETSIFAQVDFDLGGKSQLRLSAKAYHDEVYRLNEDTPYRREERELFRNRVELKDFYIDRQFDNGIYLKLGNQVLAWGFAEYLRVTDLINTEDQYTLGQQDLEDIRLQVPALLFSFNLGDWVFDNVVTHRAGRDQLAPAGDEFDQLIALRSQSLRFNRARPEDELEYFLRASTHFQRGDLQIVAAELNENNLTVERITGLSSGSPLINFSQNRMQAFGIAANVVSGPWLLFGEVGLHRDKAVRPDKDFLFRQIDGWDLKDQLLSVVGIEYNGFTNTMLSLEIDNVHTNDHDQFMQAEQDQLSAGARLYWTGLNQRLTVIGVLYHVADNAGSLGRLSIEYNWSDNLALGFMWVDYHGQRGSVLRDFRNNDVVQLELRFSFQN